MSNMTGVESTTKVSFLIDAPKRTMILSAGRGWKSQMLSLAYDTRKRLILRLESNATDHLNNFNNKK